MGRNAALLTYYGLDTTVDQVRRRYNGYLFGDDAVIYNPWSILSYARNRQSQPYWVNTSSNDLIIDILNKTDASIKHKLAALIMHQAIEGVTVNLSINFRNIMDVAVLSKEVLWNFLIISGCLKTSNLRMEGRKIEVDIRIPKEGILSLYEDSIMRWFRIDQVSYHPISLIVDDLVNARLEAFEEHFQFLVRKKFSTFDVGLWAAENFYHAFVLGLLVHLEGTYHVLSNRGSGDGRPGVLIIPVDRTKRGVVIEFKVAPKSDEASMKSAADAAVAQIERKNYMDALRYADLGRVIKVGIAFSGKTVRIGYAESAIVCQC